ncbi:hypothetical protein WJX75_006809 [Coccomyxa subellipsoidea]|uniref:BZIP domain-containing protein n=1 Tax=Coccomyxa subellipsoidea TaxID=248742 RepID=A0ABR2Z486_9CHLO
MQAWRLPGVGAKEAVGAVSALSHCDSVVQVHGPTGCSEAMTVEAGGSASTPPPPYKQDETSAVLGDRCIERSSAMSDTREKGSRQKAYRCREKEKQEANEFHLEQLSRKVAALEGCTSAYGDSKKLPDDGEIAGSFCFGEAIIQLQLTRGIVRALTVDNLTVIWKVPLLS